MKIEKLIIAIALVGLSGYASGQNGKILSAKNFLQYAELDKAKSAIDLASEHEKTQGLAKTYLVKGKVYLALAVSKDDKYKSLSDNPLKVSFESFSAVNKSEGAEKVDKDELKQGFLQLSDVMFNKGIEFFNEKQYEKAAELFVQCYQAKVGYDIIDTVSLYNTGLCYERLEKFDLSAEYYQKAMENGYGDESMFGVVANAYRKAGNDQMAMEILKKGRQANPNNQDLITAELNYYLQNEDYESALKNLDAAIANDQNNPIFFFARGSINDQNKNYDLAIADYQKAISLKDDYFDAVYNLGALYYNKGVEILEEANNLPLNENKKSVELKDKAKAQFKLALPILEKANLLNSEDKGTMVSLKSLYGQMNMTDKYNAMKEKLSN